MSTLYNVNIKGEDDVFTIYSDDAREAIAVRMEDYEVKSGSTTLNIYVKGKYGEKYIVTKHASKHLDIKKIEF